jgi:GDP-4-dehydro-6-deoxy-D-mannose reductase
VQTVFVTGAEGLVGREVLGQLQAQGYEVVAGVRNRARKLSYERQNAKALVCEVTDAINVARVIAGVRPEAVIHLAGIARPTRAAEEPLEGYQSIVSGWANILDAVRRTVPRAKVVLASACDVYGNAGQDGHPISERTAAAPVSTLGSFKRAAETIACTFHRDYHLDVTIARPFHCTGAGQSTRFFYAAVAERLGSGEAHGDGQALHLPDLSCTRDVLHVRDVAAAYVRLMQDGRPNEVYNICSGQAYTCREIVETMVAEAGLTVDLVESPSEDGQQILKLCGDRTKISSELGWEPSCSIQDALRELIVSYQVSEVAAVH